MKKKSKIIFPIFILYLLSFLLSCNRSSNETVDPTAQPVVQDTAEIPEPMLTPVATDSRELTETYEATVNETPEQQPLEASEFPSSTPTKTPTSTDTIKSQATQPQIPRLDYCRDTEDEICIGSFLSVSDNIGMVLIKPNNQDKSYILFDDQEYNCVAVPGFTDRYFCSGLPNQSNRTVSIQIFITGSSTPLAAGDIFIRQPLPQSTPTDAPKPPDPYNP